MHVEMSIFCSVLLIFLFLNQNENWLVVFTKYRRQVTNKFGKDAREEFGAAPQGVVFLLLEHYIICNIIDKKRLMAIVVSATTARHTGPWRALKLCLAFFVFFMLIPPPLWTKFSPSIPLWLVYEPTTPGYMGICHPNYPNFYWLLGPGTGLGTNSIIFMIECQVRQNNILILFRLLTCFCVWLLSCFAKLIQSEYLTKVYEIYVSRPTICTAREAESTVIEEVFKGSKVPPKLFK